MNSSFDEIAEEYDRWFDSPEGEVLFETELRCLQSICPFEGRWAEVGVGTGRFAFALGIKEGIDLSAPMLEIAKTRGIQVTLGSAENLPFPEKTFDGILLSLTLCFVDNAEEALMECRRVLRPSGQLLLGIIPTDSPWGREYISKARDGHSVYSLAHFRTAAETLELIKTSGFELTRAASALFWRPDQTPSPQPEVKAGIVSEAGFVGLLLKRESSDIPRKDHAGAM